MNNLFSKLSLDITAQLTNQCKKVEGIFFTPSNVVSAIYSFVDEFTTTNNINIKNVLEPSCGSCQFIEFFDSHLPNVNFYGVEKNKIIFNKISKLKFKNNVIIINNDFINESFHNTFDLIIGNPPYFVILKRDIPVEYSKFLQGRSNIYAIFLIKCLSLLNNNGILAFVLPKNFLNCTYYNLIRKHINENCKILNIIEFQNTFIDTDQETIVLILQKIKDNNEDFIYSKNNDLLVFNNQSNISKIKKLYENSTTLSELKCDVNIGTVVWNEVKSILTNDQNKTLLIYSGDITKNELIIKKYKNTDKKNYIHKKGKKDKIIVINRGYGKGKYSFDYCLIDIDKEYLVENHLITISNNSNNTINNYDTIIKSFNDPRTNQFIEIFFGNNAINVKELLYYLPIYL